ncbi:hypothetical protein VTP01DRAFT_5156 [Rhizomucor pusillus]|uniref:uncharacterized protein n=1 Tax=Rhizomucor pusillus TaxID=4840 RepID=UPI003743B183
MADHAAAAAAPSSSKVANQRPAVSRWVIVKLLGFTAAMFALPIATYYYTLNGIFKDNGTYAAGAAAATANVVALTYIIAAAFEDTKPKDKKE